MPHYIHLWFPSFLLHFFDVRCNLFRAGAHARESADPGDERVRAVGEAVGAVSEVGEMEGELVEIDEFVRGEAVE